MSFSIIRFRSALRFPATVRPLAACCLTLACLLGAVSPAEAVDPAAPSDPRVEIEASLESAAYAKPLSNYDLYEDYGWNVGAPPTYAGLEVHEAEMLQGATYDDTGFDHPIELMRRSLDRLYESTGLRLSFAYTAVAINSFDDGQTRSGFGGDVDFMARWDVVGRGTENWGRLFFTTETRDAYGGRAANLVGPQTGTLQNITNGWNDRGWVIRDFHYIQRLFEGKLRMALGRGDVGDGVGGHWLGSKNNAFFNRAFSANSTIAFPGHGAFAGLSLRPNDWFFITGTISDAYGDTEELSLSTVDDGDYFYTAEMGVTPHIEGLGYGRYRVLAWQMDARDINGSSIPQDRGFQVTLEQELGATAMVFVRAGFADEALTNIDRSIEGGVGFRGLFGTEGNMTGMAAGVSSPKSGGGDEKVIEAFHRWQLTPFTQLSLGGQAILDPVFSDEDAVFALNLRLRVEF